MVRVLAGELHVWIVPLDRPTPEIERLHALLSAQEQARAGSFPLPPRKRRYVARQGAVREILAGYTARDPSELEIIRRDRGKPALASGVPSFSVSDSHDLALVAVGDCELGVDVERVVERPAARRMGTLEAFYEAWTAREAAGKATGEGLFAAPAQGHWRSWRIAPAPGFLATLVAERGARRVSLRTH